VTGGELSQFVKKGKWGVPVCRFELGPYSFFLLWPRCPGCIVVGRWKGGALSFIFIALLSVYPQFGRWPFSIGSLLLSLSAVCLAFGSLLFVLREGYYGSGAIVTSVVCSDGKREEGGVVPSFTVTSLLVCLRWTPDKRL